MGLRPLLYLVGFEFGLLGLLFVLLFLWSRVRIVLGAGRARRELAAHAALRGWSEGDPAGPVRRALERCPIASLPRILGTRAARRAEEAGLSVAELVRSSAAHRRALRWARSRLWWRRLTAAELLAAAGGPGDVPTLVRLLADRHPAPATAALLGARRLRSDRLIPPLLDLTVGWTHGPLSAKEHVRIVLAGFGEALVEPLAERLRSVEDEAGRVALLQLAGRLGREALRAEIERSLAHGGLEARISAARALASLPRRGSVGPLRAALEDPAWQVRAQAAAALGRLEARTAADGLLRALADPSWWVRLRAGLALRQLGWKGERLLESVRPETDRYAHDMARYVLGLEDAAVWEYVS
ncbi:MAG TPA: HEAT repeat domain-containing protein [Gemmatimonadota bacterium]|nr:HEAT repeat domain-containing protein [Gemmatimonadota bacterium]